MCVNNGANRKKIEVFTFLELFITSDAIEVIKFAPPKFSPLR